MTTQDRYSYLNSAIHEELGDLAKDMDGMLALRHERCACFVIYTTKRDMHGNTIEFLIPESIVGTEHLRPLLQAIKKSF